MMGPVLKFCQRPPNGLLILSTSPLHGRILSQKLVEKGVDDGQFFFCIP